MNKYLFYILPFLLLGCKDSSQTKKTIPAQEAIANAYGFENWNNVNEITFTFNVDRDTSHFERTFIWEPKTKKVTYMSASDTVHFRQDSIKRASLMADKTFINDKFWLLAPFHLVWDKGVTFSEVKKELAPISKEKMNKLTITYPPEGGYTPGDAYDYYFNDDYIIQEWVYREANQEAPSMTTTWESNQDYNGIKLSTMHKKGRGDFKLYFTNISIK